MDRSAFYDFYDAHAARHRTRWSRAGSFVGDPLALAAVVLLATGRRRHGARVLGAGLAVMVAGHLAEGNLGAELASLRRSPLRALAAEARMLTSMWSGCARTPGGERWNADPRS